MKAYIAIKCSGCGRIFKTYKNHPTWLRDVDTADSPQEIGEKVQAEILAHRPYCYYYSNVQAPLFAEPA